MASRHRVRAPCLQIIKTATVPAALTKRVNVKQFHDSKISFPLTRRMARCCCACAAAHDCMHAACPGAAVRACMHAACPVCLHHHA
jgi:hypothetical protein